MAEGKDKRRGARSTGKGARRDARSAGKDEGGEARAAGERRAQAGGPEEAASPDQDARGDAWDSVEGLRDAGKGVSEGLRKAFASGIRTVLSADDVLREAMPKEVLTYMMRQTDAAKDEVVRVIGHQTRKFLENLDLAGEMQKILTSVSFEIKTEIRFIPNDQSVVRPQVKVRSAGRTTGRAAAPEANDDAGSSPSEEDMDRSDPDRGAGGRRSRLGAAVDRALGGVFGREGEGAEWPDDELDDGDDGPPDDATRRRREPRTK